MRAVLAGIAIGGFAATVVEANRITVQALWRFNCLAAEIAWVMVKTPLEPIIRETSHVDWHSCAVTSHMLTGTAVP